MEELANKKLEDNKKEIEKAFENKYKNKEKEMENKLNEMSQIIQEKTEENSKIKKSRCDTTHHGIKCDKCNKVPIYGYRYKCSECNNYNLCENCEEENSITEDHPHNFIKIKKEENNNKNKGDFNIFNNINNLNDKNDFNNNMNKSKKRNEINEDFKNNMNNFKNINEINNNLNNKNNNINAFDNEAFNNNGFKIHNNNNNFRHNFDNLINNIDNDVNNNNNNKFNDIKEDNMSNNGDEFNLINNNINDINMDDDKDNDKKTYSFECVNKNNLYREIFEGENEIKLNLMLKNNKDIVWPVNNTRLVFDFNSNFVQNDIILQPQKYNETKNYEMIINDLGEYPPGDYNIYLRFEVNGEQFGDRIEINLVIKEKQNDDLIKVNEFRRNFNLAEKDYPNDKILSLLKKYNFDYDNAFVELVNV